VTDKQLHSHLELLPTMDTLQMQMLFSKIDSLPDEYLAIKKQALKYLKNNSNISVLGTLNIFHRPWIARLNWGLMLYKGAEMKWFEQYREMTKRDIPEFYTNFLQVINGCFIYDISLAGLTPSMYMKGTLDRSILQCHDLKTANIDWIKEYEVDRKYFHFGGRHYSPTENLGYFFDGDKIMAILPNGNIINEWTNYFDFLFDEIELSEQKALKNIPKGTNIIVNEIKA
jgi:hypothetical protein